MFTRKSMFTACFVTLLTLGLSACGGGSDQPDEPTGPDPALVDARNKAAMAATQAADAAGDADDAVMAQEANRAADEVSYALARNAADRAQAASNAAAAASEAARTADTVEAAQAAYATAAAKRDEARNELANAMKYAGMVATAHRDAVAAEGERVALSTAKGLAQTAASEARTAADRAGKLADEAEGFVGADHPFAKATRDAAIKAGDAADEADKANRSAQSSTTSGDAQRHQMSAETEKGNADKYLQEAMKQRDNAQHAKKLVDAEIEKRRDAAIGNERERAGGAVTGADGAAESADGYADEAEAFAMNRATIQTEDDEGNPNSVEDAEKSREYAKKAADEAIKAKEASDKAAEAETEADARMYADAAVVHQTAAEGYRDKAKSYRDMAEMDSMDELKVDDKTKSVGHTSITVGTNMSTTTIDGVTHVTGQFGKISDVSVAVAGQAFSNSPSGDGSPNPENAYIQAVEMRSVDIGVQVDSADDTARLTLVESYIGTEKGKVFSMGAASTETGTEPGRVDSGIANTENDVFLTSEGMYYRAGTGTGANLVNSDAVAAGTKPQQVYSVTWPANAVNGTPGDTEYLVLSSTATDPGTGVTTYTYTAVDVTAAAVDADDDGTAEETMVTADIPVPTDYDHIHFGVWNAMEENSTRHGGTNQAIANLGIGFVHNYNDSGMTEDMPNNGDATYSGNWVANVQEADPDGDGAITSANGKATLVADFGDGDVTAMLAGLATLEGTISGSEFAGTKATVVTNTHGVTPGDDFDGSFDGAFFGAKAAEAGGVFDFASDDNEDGAFRGAFGGDRQ